MIKKLIFLLFLLGILVTACNSEPAALTIMVTDSFAVSKDVITEFETANNVKVNFLLSGDAGSMLNKAILTKNAPVADILYGLDSTFLSRALSEGIFENYGSPLLQQIPDQFKLDKENQALPVDFGDVCINYDKQYFSDKSLNIPASLEDLAKPMYRGLLVVENPATSSPGLAFLLSTIAEYGPDGFLAYWGRLKENGVVVVNDWNTAYYANFSGSSGKGPQPMVVSYGTSPAAEVIFADPKVDEAPTASLVGKNMCFRQIEFVGILKGSKKRALAQKFVDFMLSKRFQEDIPLNMFVFPANKTAQLPAEFSRFIQIPEQPAVLSPDQISTNREKWIEAWRVEMLQ
jgi:thiamine transport system substrate-binding protein